jgi:predicted PurR-regulated permease PerM
MQSIRFTLASLFGVLITAAAVAVIWNFIPILLWALIISIVVWPVFKFERKVLKDKDTLSALILTLVVAVLIAIPVFSVLKILISEGQLFLNFILKLDRQGAPIPVWLVNMPYGNELVVFWKNNLLQPGKLSSLLSVLHFSAHSTGMWFSQLGSSIAHWFITLFFTLIALFFFLQEGAAMLCKFDLLGRKHLQGHWDAYWNALTRAMVATVNGTVMLGFALGLLMGLVYWAVGLPAPALAGCLTAVLAMIPFGAILMFLVMGVIAYIKTGVVAALVVLVVGIILNLLADHLVRPLLLGSSTKLPFLAILFGILGGVELMGLLGLFLGPMIMVAFLSLWRSSTTA